MCGILGVASNAGGVDMPVVDRMRDSMRHRGPDCGGSWASKDRRVVLAHRRLAIIDPSAAGRQPMEDASGECCITFNGAIYNFRELRVTLEALGFPFGSTSDTEVLLNAYRAWGLDCLSKLNGMFAFGLYDTKRRTVFLARDRTGEKPLFYRHTKDTLVFASELKALMEDPSCPRTLDADAMALYLAYGYVPGERCILKGVCKLRQGHAALFDTARGTLKLWRYWQLPDGAPVREHTSEDELVEKLEGLLLDSVRRQLVADVPVGILLSGGIDSSLVTAMAARVSSGPVRTFTISFPGHQRHDESAHARLVARHFDTEHTELAAEAATVNLLPQLARQYDEPLADSSMVPTYLVSRLIREYATVALGGDGGDELFAGYLHYNWIQRQALARALLPEWLRRMVSTAAAELVPVGSRGRNYLMGLAGDINRSIAHANLFFDSGTRRRLLHPGWVAHLRTAVIPEEYKARLCRDHGTALQRATAVDFTTYLADDILVKVDRASMLTSLEARAPWLDYRIVEMAFGCVPDTLRAARGQRKILPRRLAARVLPAGLDLDRKQGFALPLRSWFKGDWGRYIEGVLSEADTGLFSRAAVRRLLAAQRHGLANEQRLFALTMFELWRREYKVSV